VTTQKAGVADANQADSKISQPPETVCYKMRVIDDFGHVDKQSRPMRHLCRSVDGKITNARNGLDFADLS